LEDDRVIRVFPMAFKGEQELSGALAGHSPCLQRSVPVKLAMQVKNRSRARPRARSA
jgi:hypothetical protein